MKRDLTNRPYAYIVFRNADRSVECKALYYNSESGLLRNEDLEHDGIHSPDGFEYGYGGSGPAELAYAITHHYSPDVAGPLYKKFKKDFIEPADMNKPLIITATSINKWLLCVRNGIESSKFYHIE